MCEPASVSGGRARLHQGGARRTLQPVLIGVLQGAVRVPPLTEGNLQPHCSGLGPRRRACGTSACRVLRVEGARCSAVCGQDAGEMASIDPS